MRRLLILMAALAATLAVQTPLRAETVVALGNDLRYGVCHSAPLAKSRGCAMSNCFKFSTIPVTCKVVYRSEERGHYALAIGAFAWGVGQSASSEDDAAATAMGYCQASGGACVLAATWEEAPEDD